MICCLTFYLTGCLLSFLYSICYFKTSKEKFNFDSTSTMLVNLLTTTASSWAGFIFFFFYTIFD